MAYRPKRRMRLALALGIATALLAVPAVAAAKPAQVKVMTRNLYLGADLTNGVNATSVQSLVDAAGGILQEIDQNKFPVRAKGLAAEILKQKPDLVGLQEVTQVRTGPCTESPIPPKATQVRYDYLKLLLAQLNKGKNLYRAAVKQPEFDFEIYVNTDGNEATAAPGCPFGSELNARLTLNDVILARRGTAETSKAKRGHFDTLEQVKPGGVPFNITRGWTQVDAKVHGSKFRFVNVHFESFDSRPGNHTNKNTDVGVGQIRQAQAAQLVGKGGAATGKLPVILVGDLNSDTKTEVNPGDGLAYKTVTNAGFVERSTSNPLSCCIKAHVISATGGGSIGDFNHKVDHVLTDAPGKFKLVRSVVTGRNPVNGFWDSDHAGLFSALTLP